eukprot:TRINITY_DN76463_c0_g1_i1.p1 TRINITY_DN76463_c0_g1~~TRINITY_DN76463_c0_g1_i1.p1  ORF type:complete len:363 (+),score=29.87 TRINITY_DN76463_c0_g1_i1:125-1090(+)
MGRQDSEAAVASELSSMLDTLSQLSKGSVHGCAGFCPGKPVGIALGGAREAVRALQQGQLIPHGEEFVRRYTSPFRQRLFWMKLRQLLWPSDAQQLQGLVDDIAGVARQSTQRERSGQTSPASGSEVTVIEVQHLTDAPFTSGHQVAKSCAYAYDTDAEVYQVVTDAGCHFVVDPEKDTGVTKVFHGSPTLATLSYFDDGREPYCGTESENIGLYADVDPFGAPLDYLAKTGSDGYVLELIVKDPEECGSRPGPPFSGAGIGDYVNAYAWIRFNPIDQSGRCVCALRVEKAYHVSKKMREYLVEYGSVLPGGHPGLGFGIL